MKNSTKRSLSQRPLDIGLFCTASETTPPKGEIIHAPLWLTAHLADKLVALGHKVTLYGAAGSKTRAKLVARKLTDWNKNKFAAKLVKEGLVGTNRRLNVINDQTLLLEALRGREHDIVHAHTELALPLAALSKTPFLITYHSPFNQYFEKLFCHYQKNYSNIFFSALSQTHAQSAPGVRFAGITPNGVDVKDLSFDAKGGNTLLFAGRLIYEKGADIAIQVAKQAGQKLILAGEKFAPLGKRLEFWKQKIENEISPNIKYIGFIPPARLIKHYQSARALLFPSRGQESFGLVLVEALACGTPVISFNRGAAKDIIKNEVNGYIVNNQRQMIKAVKKIYSLPLAEYRQMRLNARQSVVEKYSLEAMAKNYEALYEEILKSNGQA